MKKTLLSLVLAIMFIFSSTANTFALSFDIQDSANLNAVGASSTAVKAGTSTINGKVVTQDVINSYKSNCVYFSRWLVPSLPTGLDTYQGKLNIINSSSPSVGSVAIMPNSSGVGHVAVVEAVNGSQITLIESNWPSSGVWRRTGTQSGLNIKGYYKPGNSASSTNSIKPTITYRSHVQNHGWMAMKSEGQISGTTGEGLRLEAFNIAISSNSGARLRFQAHIQNYGWVNAAEGTNVESGSTGLSLRMEAIKLELLNCPEYSIEYRCHVENYGWMAWQRDGAVAGTTGQSLRIEAIEVRIVKK